MPRPRRTASLALAARHFTRGSLLPFSGLERKTYTEDNLRYKISAEQTTSASTVIERIVAEGAKRRTFAAPETRGTSRTARHDSRIRTAREGGVSVGGVGSRKRSRGPTGATKPWPSRDQQGKQPLKRTKTDKGGSAVSANHAGRREAEATNACRGTRSTEDRDEESHREGTGEEDEHPAHPHKTRRQASGNGCEAPQRPVPRKRVHFHHQLELDEHFVGVANPATSDSNTELSSLSHSSSSRSDKRPPLGSSLGMRASLSRTNLAMPPDASLSPSSSPGQGGLGLTKTPGLSEIRMTVYHPPRAPLSVLPPNALLALLSSGRGAAPRVSRESIARPESDQVNSPSQYLDTAGPSTGLARGNAENSVRLSPSRSFQQVLSVPIEGPGVPPSLLLDKRRSPRDVTSRPPLDTYLQLLLTAGTLVDLAVPQLVDVSLDRHLRRTTPATPAVTVLVPYKYAIYLQPVK